MGYLKEFAERGLVIFVSRLPDDAQRALLVSLARRFNVSGLRADGDYGQVVSAVGDFAVFDTYARTRRWAADTNNLFSTFFSSRHGTYFDIGANIGLTTIPIARNHMITCHAFEPDPTNFHNLRQNILINCDANNVRLYDIALFSERSTLQFEIAERNLGDHRIRIGGVQPGQWGEEARRTISVSAVPLDELEIEIVGPLAVKIDTQGAEPYIIEGGKSILSKAELLVMEFSLYHMHRMRGDPRVAIDFLRKNFSSGAIADGESCFEQYRPIAQVCDQLESLMDDSDNVIAKTRYFDVCALR